MDLTTCISLEHLADAAGVLMVCASVSAALATGTVVLWKWAKKKGAFK